MYSRRFNDYGVTPPPDYGGVTYRAGEGTAEQPPEMREEQRTYSLPEMPKEEREQKVRGTFSRSSDRKEGTRDDRRIRRPIYHSPKIREEKTRQLEKEQESEKGLLSGLFSLTGRKFSMEDIVLAGLILLMMSDREKEGVDGEILLILGLLLLTK